MIKNASKAKTWAPSKIYTVSYFGLLQLFSILKGFFLATLRNNITYLYYVIVLCNCQKPLKMDSDCIIVSNENDDMQRCVLILK